MRQASYDELNAHTVKQLQQASVGSAPALAARLAAGDGRNAPCKVVHRSDRPGPPFARLRRSCVGIASTAGTARTS